MDMSAYIEEIKMQLSGNLLDIELDDKAFIAAINSSLREIQRYIDITGIITVPYSGCIDVKPYNISSVSNIYRATSYLIDDDSGKGLQDPMYVAQWQMLSGNGGIYNISTYVNNMAAWNQLLTIRNTLSTDLMFRYDKPSEKLYINCAYNIPEYITIEYVPKFTDVSQITSDFWIDILMRMSIAKCKIALGRIRTRFSQSNALWTQDGEIILAEGNEELKTLRDFLDANTQLSYAVD